MSDDEKLLEKARNIVNAEFLEEVLKKSDNDSTFKVTDVEVKFATNKGDNYTSDMFRIIFNFSRNDNLEAKEKRQYIVKLPPMTSGASQNYITESPLFDTEIDMMSDTLKKMNDFFEPEERLNAQCPFFRRGRGLIMVIEDLAPLGYRMSVQKHGVDLDHSLLVIRNIAKFHAGTVAMCEKEPRLKDKYKNRTFHEGQKHAVKEMFKDSVRQFADTVSKWEELDQKYKDKLHRLADTIFEKGRIACMTDPTEFNVINHGDCWLKNMLFKYDDEGKPIKHIFVDFQLCDYSSAAMDLLYFFYTSVTDEVLVEKEDYFMEQYMETLLSTMKRLECRTKPPTMDELKAAMVKKALMGLFATIMILPFILMGDEEAFSSAEIITDDGKFRHPDINTKRFRAILARRIKIFDELGTLD